MYTAVCTVGGMRLKLQLSYDSISYVSFLGEESMLAYVILWPIAEDIGSSHLPLTWFVS